MQRTRCSLPLPRHFNRTRYTMQKRIKQPSRTIVFDRCICARAVLYVQMCVCVMLTFCLSNNNSTEHSLCAFKYNKHYTQQNEVQQSIQLLALYNMVYNTCTSFIYSRECTVDVFGTTASNCADASLRYFHIKPLKTRRCRRLISMGTRHRRPSRSFASHEWCSSRTINHRCHAHFIHRNSVKSVKMSIFSATV